MDALTIALELSATYEQLSESLALVQTSMPGPQQPAPGQHHLMLLKNLRVGWPQLELHLPALAPAWN